MEIGEDDKIPFQEEKKKLFVELKEKSGSNISYDIEIYKTDHVLQVVTKVLMA